MTLRKKIVLSNVLTVVIPIIMILIIWSAYVNLGSGAYLKPINHSLEGEDHLTESMNILYTYEAELSDMSWDVVTLPGDSGLEVVVSPEKERVEELKSLGYHLQLETANGTSFSNMDESDLKVLEEATTNAGGAVFWSGSSIVIRDNFHISGQKYYLTAVYNDQRADSGVRDSLLPMYMISPTVIIVLLVIAVGSFLFTTAMTAHWLNRSVLIPLEELKRGADRIAGGDLDYRISYTGQDEIGDVCIEFDHMRQQLKEAGEERRHYENDRRDMLRGLSHDLRSPLTSIKGYAMGLKDGIANTEEKRNRYYDAILTRADDLERLLGSLSLLVKLENDNDLLHLEKVCLDEYIRQFLSEKEPWLSEQHIDAEYRTERPDAEAALDIREMQRVFMNLFENTVKYRTSNHSNVNIDVKCSDDEIEICFSDDGPGVDARHIKHLFDSFYRADESRTNPEKGSGLGLAVVKRIIEGQGGRIYAGSEKGLCIVMILPAVKENRIYEENPDC